MHLKLNGPFSSQYTDQTQIGGSIGEKEEKNDKTI
jgi:hypothetical protein